MIHFHGENKRRSYFEGWYFKHQSLKHSLAFIPGINIDECGNRSSFIQIITGTTSYNVTYPYSQFTYDVAAHSIKIGNNTFTEKGIQIDIENEEVACHGSIQYGSLAPIAYDIMGPFRFVPFMECNHGIVSMKHTINGAVTLNNHQLSFEDGIGYIETDWGTSFPKSYAWVQCNQFIDMTLSIFASIATIPFMGGTFKGCICVILHNAKEYRLATYKGAKVISCDENSIVIKQNRYKLKIQIIGGSPQTLIAPKDGAMNHIIHEHTDCKSLYQFYNGDTLIFDAYSQQGSFEYVE